MTSEPNLVKFRNKSAMSKSKSTASLDEYFESEVKIGNLSELAFGDHIVISVDAKNYCHAIVEALSHEKNVLDIIYYDDTDTQCALDCFMLNGPSCALIRTTVIEENTGSDASSRKGSSSESTDSKASDKKDKKKEEKERKEKEKKEKKEKKERERKEKEEKKKREKEKDPNNEEVDNCRTNGVKKSTLLIDLAKVEIYKVNYDPIKEPCLTAQETVEKARQFVGKQKYNIFINNDEHFAIYCKTGKAAKLFVIDPADLTAKKIIGRDISDKIVVNLAQEGGQILLVNTAKHIATKFPRSALSAGLPAAAEVAGGMIGVAVEGFSTTYDIYQKHKEKKEGKLSSIKFKKYVARRVTRGTMGVAGGVAGGIIGQLVIPIPVVGAVVGSLVGGIVGAVAGQGEGILIGELVEVIDNKIKEKKSEKLKKEDSKESLLDGVKESVSESKEGIISGEDVVDADQLKVELPQIKLASEELPETNQKLPEKIEETVTTEVVKYSVIDKLVFKFDKDILKPEKWAYLKEVVIKVEEEPVLAKIDPNEINILRSSSQPSEEPAMVLDNASKYINDDDYEIYVLKDSNEVITKLNVSNVIDENGAISKRRSIENFSGDVLPDKINVFFKIDEEDETGKNESN